MTFKKRTENNTWIMAKTDIQSTHAFQIDRSDRLVLSPLSWCTTCGGFASTSAGGDSGGSFTSDEEERRGRNYNLASAPSYVIYSDCAGGRPSLDL